MPSPNEAPFDLSFLKFEADIYFRVLQNDMTVGRVISLSQRPAFRPDPIEFPRSRRATILGATSTAAIARAV